MKPTNILLISSLLSGLSPFTIAHAADGNDTNGAEEIIVTANRRAQPLSQVGSSVTVLTEQDLQASQQIFLLNALESVPGLSSNQTGAFGGTASISIRGAGGNNTLMLFDGVQLNDSSSPSNAFNFGTLDTANIARIEVLRGPQSVLYGSDAIGGVINVITKTYEDGFGGQVFGEYGSFDSFRGGAQLHGGSEAFGFNLSASGSHSDGISAADENDGNSERDGYKDITITSKITSKLTENLRLEFIGRYADTNGEFDSFGPVDGDETALTEELTLAGRVYYDAMDGKLQNTLSVEYNKIDRESISGTFGTFGAVGELFNVDYIGSVTLGSGWSLTAGAQHEASKSINDSADSFTINSLLAELGYASDNGLALTAGIRYDDHETFGSATTGRITGSYNIKQSGTRLFASWGEGFKAPSIFQLTFICGFCGLTEPSIDLAPERATGYDFGIEQKMLDDRITFGATYFHLTTHDAIDFTFFAGYQNVSQLRAKGFELMIDAELGEMVSLRANYTRNLTRDIDAGVRVAREPRNAFAATLNISPSDRLNTSISATYNGSELNSFGAGILDDWLRLDVRATYDLGSGLSLYGRIENIFDTEYQSVLGYGTPDRSIFAGIRKSF